jgi:hypothetical protein
VRVISVGGVCSADILCFFIMNACHTAFRGAVIIMFDISGECWEVLEYVERDMYQY